MSITKSEAIAYLAMLAAKADGRYSKEEISGAMRQIPEFHLIINEVDGNDNFKTKAISGELNKSSAIETLNTLSKEDKLEALAICWLVANSDGIFDAAEQEFINELENKLGVTDVKAIKRKADRLLGPNATLMIIIIFIVIILVLIMNYFLYN